ncbi:MAG TPA: CBS domain-containing protein [Blastocatellia bacterium]|nr:CBS domain-containing protein [Blastocatellia bacterium]
MREIQYQRYDEGRYAGRVPYGPGPVPRGRGEDRGERGFFERTGDEVRSWFGDDEAEYRRRMDERFHEQRGREGSSFRPGEVRARDVMTHNVITAHAWDTVERAARLMGDCDCGSLPVIGENGRLIGVVTDRDIAVRVVARGKDPRRARVEECMSGDIVACEEYDSIESCMRQMARHQIRRLPIVDDRNYVVGIISQSDLARHAGKHPGWGERRAMADVLCAVSDPAHAPRR